MAIGLSLDCLRMPSDNNFRSVACFLDDAKCFDIPEGFFLMNECPF